MKQLFAVLLAAVMLFAMSLNVFAAEEIEIPLVAENIGKGAASADELTIVDGSINADGVTIFAVNIPEIVPLGETVVVHIKGTTDGDFRCWLLGAPGTQNTFATMWKASENGFSAPGEFEKYIEMTAADVDNNGSTEADAIAVKAPSFDAKLDNFTLTYLGIYYGPMSDLEGDAVAEAQPLMDDSDAAVAAAEAATDDSARQAALADAEAALEALTEKAAVGFPGLVNMQKQANDNIKTIRALITQANADDVLEGLQSYIDTVNTALETAQNAGSDVEAAEAALADANAAAAEIEAAANEYGYDSVLSASSAAKLTVREIESLVEDAKNLKAEEEEQARKTTTTIVIIVVAVVLVVVIVAVVLSVLKKKKK